MNVQWTCFTLNCNKQWSIYLSSYIGMDFLWLLLWIRGAWFTTNVWMHVVWHVKVILWAGHVIVRLFTKLQNIKQLYGDSVCRACYCLSSHRADCFVLKRKEGRKSKFWIPQRGSSLLHVCSFIFFCWTWLSYILPGFWPKSLGFSCGKPSKWGKSCGFHFAWE